MKDKAKRGTAIRLSIAAAIFIASLVVGSLLMGAASHYGPPIEFYRLSEAAPFEQFRTNYGSIAELKEDAHSVSRQVQVEGSVLLLNNEITEGPGRLGAALPINVNTETNLAFYDVTSVDPIWGGMGSGMAGVTGGRPGSFNATGGFEAAGKTGIFDSPFAPVAESRQSWRTSFEDRGFSINTGLWNWYDSLPRAATHLAVQDDRAQLRGTTTGSHMATFNIGGASWAQMPTAYRAQQADVAFFVLGRMGGEDFDRQLLSWDQGVPMPDHLATGAPSGQGLLRDGANTQRSYLVLSDKERTVLDELATLRENGTFGRLVLIMNTTNQPELDWLMINNEYNFDAAVWVGGLGQDGIEGVVDLLTGKENFSGRLSQMFFNRHADNPVMANFGSYAFNTGQMNRSNGSGPVPLDAPAGIDQDERYVVYQEGMYLGYRYAETRFADVVMNRPGALENGTWDGEDFDYETIVAFPFGGGLSYTTFTYSDLSVVRRDITTPPTRPAAGRERVRLNRTFYEATVTVTNTGTVPGREVVSIYLQRPFGQYHIDNYIEIPAVELVGYDKSPVLAVGESWTTTIEIDEKFFAAYDAHGEGTFIASGGDYFLSVANGPFGAHQAINNILALKDYAVPSGTAFRNTVGTANMAVRIGYDTPVRHDFGASTSELNEAGRTKYSVSEITGNPIVNLFCYADINRFDKAVISNDNPVVVRGATPSGMPAWQAPATPWTAVTGNEENRVVYLSRADWAGTTVFVDPTLREHQQTSQTVLFRTQAMFDYMHEERSQVFDEVPGQYPTMRDEGVEATLTIADLAVRRPNGELAYEFTHQRWQDLLDQLSWADYLWLLSDGLRRTMDLPSIGKLRTSDVNGPLGFSPRYGDSAMANIFPHYSFRDQSHPPFVNFGVGEKDPGVQGFANIGVFWDEASESFLPRRDTAWHRARYAANNNGAHMMQIIDPDHIAYTTAFPSNNVLASTFNSELAEQVGIMIGEDALWAGYSGIYGTGINILRTAHQGRVFEYFSECGFLTGRMSSAWSRGVQSMGAYVYNKHFVLNEQELSRYGISQFLTEQTLREIYLRAFEIPIIEDNARALMGTLARVGIEYGPSSYNLMTRWLRGEAGFTGFQVTDWWLGHQHLEAGATPAFLHGSAYRFNTGYYMNLSRTILAGNDLPDGVIGHVSLDLYRPEGVPQSPFRSSSSHHYNIYLHGERVLPGRYPEGVAAEDIRFMLPNHHRLHLNGEDAVRFRSDTFLPMAIFGESGQISHTGFAFTANVGDPIPYRVHNADIVWAMRASAHRILYTTTWSNLTNELSSAVRARESSGCGCGGCGSGGGGGAAAMSIGGGAAFMVAVKGKKKEE